MGILRSWPLWLAKTRYSPSANAVPNNIWAENIEATLFSAPEFLRFPVFTAHNLAYNANGAACIQTAKY